MENSNELKRNILSVDNRVHWQDGTDLESELSDAILKSSSIFSFKYFCERYLTRKYNQEQIGKAFQSLINKNYLSNDSQFNIIKLHLQSVFPHSTPQVSDHWVS